SACASATLHIVVEAPKPDMEFVKTAALTVDNGTVGKADVNDVITYTFTVTNTGNVTLTGVLVTDPLSDLSTLNYTWPGAPNVLASGEVMSATATYTVKQSDVDAGSIDNQATVTLDVPDGGAIGPVESGNDPSDPGMPGNPGDPTVIDAVDPTPNLTFVKVADQTTDVASGETITYSFTVTNTGNVTLSDVTI